MFEHFFGLRRSLFGLTPDPEFIAGSVAHRDAIAGLLDTIQARKGFSVLIGDAGTGKTTLLRLMMSSIPPNMVSLYYRRLSHWSFSKWFWLLGSRVSGSVRKAEANREALPPTRKTAVSAETSNTDRIHLPTSATERALEENPISTLGEDSLVRLWRVRLASVFARSVHVSS